MLSVSIKLCNPKHVSINGMKNNELHRLYQQNLSIFLSLENLGYIKKDKSIGINMNAIGINQRSIYNITNENSITKARRTRVICFINLPILDETFFFIFSIYQFDVFLDAIPSHNIQAKLHEDAMLIAFSIVNVSHKLDVWVSKYVIPLKDNYFFQ